MLDERCGSHVHNTIVFVVFEDGVSLGYSQDSRRLLVTGLEISKAEFTRGATIYEVRSHDVGNRCLARQRSNLTFLARNALELK
jgi:hypothetical protein